MARPPLFDSPDELEGLIDGYFNNLSADDVPTVNGLAYALGMHRDTLVEYGKKPEFSDTIKRARTRLELAWERRLAGPNAAGTIFWLKNQGWSDKSEQVVTASVEHSGGVSVSPDEAYLRMLNGG